MLNKLEKELLKSMLYEQAWYNLNVSKQGEQRDDFRTGFYACQKQLIVLVRDFLIKISKFNDLEKSHILTLLRDEVMYLSIDEESDELKFEVNCSDLFSRGWHDLEEATIEDLDDIINLKKSGVKWYSLLWCCQKRKMRPRKCLLEVFKDEKEKQLFLDCGEE